jgi:hypothetical protein
MNERNDGGPAFPVESVATGDGGRRPQLYAGISKRDYFAGLAMQAAATNPVGADGFTFEERAEWAYRQADAMLKERAK